ncbi:alpha-D-ribose 1-methylphosphonate 5-triphosphate synthase subunit PhnG [Salinihabitans flavidus]|uniref:Alpha-D-ribose 1-methylphosphonate 5-triphosphate synthase subunit PhnG n=1 Tax=Salinihabitans flavidus TaxID=569882 RepID=A0A1H8QW59_9RHOB|nr:phosphonate C-P lyase system protein PhnG [Salinihabitans flavidus]SEO58221.1 alpha-D-ribose 1-methylphosphonate 5-triphosphate synthase subunit PhnG [Salinihabitans flavidus]
MNETTDRRSWLGLLAKAPEEALDACWTDLGESPEFSWLRTPEIGGVMVRGRAGATGAPFNLGEMTVTRCALRLGDGTVGHGYVQGRSTRKAERAALCDALLQGPKAGAVRAHVLKPLAEQAEIARQARAARAAATKVDFFTMVRGED